MKIVHQIYKADINTPLNLANLLQNMSETRMMRSPFACLLSKMFRATTFIFPSGKIICHGNELEIKQYCSFLGNPSAHVTLVTSTAVHDLGMIVDYRKLALHYGTHVWEPELFNGAIIKKDRVNVNVFHTGKMVFCGLKDKSDWDIAWEMIMEIKLVLTL